MRALEFITGHVIFKLRYNQIYQLKTTNDIWKRVYIPGTAGNGAPGPALGLDWPPWFLLFPPALAFLALAFVSFLLGLESLDKPCEKYEATVNDICKGVYKPLAWSYFESAVMHS